MKRLALLVVLLVSLLGFAVSVQAETEKTYGKFLQEIGLIKGSDKGLQEGNLITREEMVTILVRLESDKQTYESFVAPKTPSFKDVPANHWAYRDIEYAYWKGLTGGIGEGKFGLKKKITYDQASLFLLRSLGYDGKDINFAHASKEIAKKYGLKLQNREVGKALLKRDQVFELMVKALTMTPKTATGFTKLHTVNLDWTKVDKWLEAVKNAKPLPDRKKALRYYNNEFVALDLSIYPKNIEDYIKADYVREGYDNGKIHDKKMKKFIQEYLGGNYKTLPLEVGSFAIKADEYDQTEEADIYTEEGYLDNSCYFYVAYTVDKDGNVIEAIGSGSYGTGYGKKEKKVEQPVTGSEF